jgi:hypothetical protein
MKQLEPPRLWNTAAMRNPKPIVVPVVVLGTHDRDDYLDPEWLKKFQSLEKVKAVLEDMDSALRQLQAAAGLELEPLGLIAEGEAADLGS